MRPHFLFVIAVPFLAAAAAAGASCTFPDFEIGPPRGTGGSGGGGGASVSSSNGSGASGGVGGATSTASTGGSGGAGGDPLCTGAGGAGGSGGGGGTGGADPCDGDGDGQRATAYPCCGTDCDDGNPDAFKFQTEYFTVPDSDLDDGGFDYDCDGTSEKDTSQLLGQTGSLDCSGLLCSLGSEGYGTNATCGANVDEYYQCTGIAELCSAKAKAPPAPLGCK